MEETRRGGLLIRVGDARAFVPATVAVRVAPVPKIARLVGAPPELLGIGLFEGALIPIVTVVPGDPPARFTSMLVCAYGGEQMGFVGLEVLSSGTYPADATVRDGVLDDGRPVPPFDAAHLYARVQGARWAYGQRPG